MNELHWTGAALLLAVAALGGSSTRARRPTELSWDDFAREHGLGGGAPATPAPTPCPLADATPAPARAAVTASVPARAVVRAAEPVGSSSPPSRSGRGAGGVGRPTWLRATATCGHCGRTMGDLEWDAAAPAKRAVLRPPGGAPTQVVSLRARLRCAHCGGPVFAEEPEPIVARAPLSLAPARRGRPRKAAPRAS
ncbi:MAG TPA: hypothetical protein VFE37_05790 [Chloroflexota bacterium]|nr:hypothetical protein [Chloroflexota bacterium]